MIKKGKEIVCSVCKHSFYVPKHRCDKAKFCSYNCYHKTLVGRTLSVETIKKMSDFQRVDTNHSGRIKKGETRNPNHIKNLRNDYWSNPNISQERKVETKSRLRKSFFERISDINNHPRWKKDRSTLVKKEMRNDSAYVAWRREVRKRDGNTCKIKNKDCKGRLEVHHILGWKEYPELRYEVNNGISLCHYHHPKKKEDVDRLIPTFKEMVSNLLEHKKTI